MRSMVEGLFGAGVENVLEDPFCIRLQLGRRNPDDAIAIVPQPTIPLLVAIGIVAHLMHNSVDLDSELG